MIKRKRLGQHFLNSLEIARLIVSQAKITKEDVVFELGLGLGILTPLLCIKAKKVISVELDRDLVENAKSKFDDVENLTIKSGDGFKQKDTFTIFVSNLPYSRSRHAIEWLAQTSFSHGVIMVQKEFAEKLLETSPKKRKAITVIANYAFEIRNISTIDKNHFSPPPKIDSVVLKIIQKNRMKKEQIQTINKIFSYRRKTMKNILKQFNKKSTMEKRLEDLSGDQLISIGNQILQK